MDGFTVASITTSCGNISTRATSSVLELDELAGSLRAGSDTPRPRLEQIVALSGEFTKLRQHADELKQGLGSASVISETLQALLMATVRSCEDATVVMDKKVKLLDANNARHLDIETAAGYRHVLSANSQVFRLFVQCLFM